MHTFEARGKYIFFFTFVTRLKREKLYLKRHNFVGNERKLKPKYYGPYMITIDAGSNSYKMVPYDYGTQSYDYKSTRYKWATQDDLKVLHYGEDL